MTPGERAEEFNKRVQNEWLHLAYKFPRGSNNQLLHESFMAGARCALSVLSDLAKEEKQNDKG